MLEVLYDEFHGCEYIKFSKIDQYIRKILKKHFINKKICINIIYTNKNQHLANFIIDEQLLV